MKRFFRRAFFLRWGSIAALAAIAVPQVALWLFGFIWLGEKGYLLAFIALSAALAAAVLLARTIARRARARASQTESALADDLAVQPDDDWNEAERALYRRLSARIGTMTSPPMDWSRLPEAAVGIVRDVARELKGPGASELDFTIPEALLLVEMTASRYRGHLKEQMPFSDVVSLKHLHNLWRHRDTLRRYSSRLVRLYGIYRALTNPAAGLLREVEQVVTSGHADILQSGTVGALQALLLEEVAHTAINLYTGRLRFSDAELLEIQLADAEEDRAAIADPPTPPRILVVGQVSAGKSSLINALVGSDTAETDMPPTTDRAARYPIEIEGVECHLIDTPGLDGSSRSRDTILALIAEADMVLWTVRANRPARAPDAALVEAFHNWKAANPARQPPPVIAAATCVDELAPGWPYPENALPPDVQLTFAAAVDAIERETGLPKPYPVRARTPDWNVELLRKALAGQIGKALMVQRNRARVAGASRKGALGQLARAGRGLVSGRSLLDRHLGRRHTEAQDET